MFIIMSHHTCFVVCAPVLHSSLFMLCTHHDAVPFFLNTFWSSPIIRTACVTLYASLLTFFICFMSPFVLHNLFMSIYCSYFMFPFARTCFFRHHTSCFTYCASQSCPTLHMIHTLTFTPFMLHPSCFIHYALSLSVSPLALFIILCHPWCPLYHKICCLSCPACHVSSCYALYNSLCTSIHNSFFALPFVLQYFRSASLLTFNFAFFAHTKVSSAFLYAYFQLYIRPFFT